MNSRYSLIVLVCIFLFSACTSPKKTNLPSESSKVQKIKKNDQPLPVMEVEPTSKVVAEDQGVFDDERFQLKTDVSKWKLIDEQNGIQTFERIQTNNGLVAFRGEVLIHAPLKKVATVLVHQPHQKHWVHAFVNGYNVAEINDLEYIQYSETKVPWPFENRDFVFRAKVIIDRSPATMLISMKSEPHPKAPPIEGIVRGEMIHSYYYLKENKNGSHTKMVVEMEVDPKGAIPLWLVNLSQRGWPHNTLSGVRKMALKKDISVLKKLDQYFDVKDLNKGKKK